MSLRTIIFILLLAPLSSLADLHFSAGSNFASVYTMEDPSSGLPLASGNAVYLIYDVDGDGAVEDVDIQTGSVLAPDILLGTYAIGDGAFAPFKNGGMSGRIDFPALNAALAANGNATQAQLYLRIFNVDDPTTADISNGDVYYGDSYASDASVISEASAWSELGGFYQYDMRDDDSPLQPQWTLGTIVLNRQLRLPNVPPVAQAGPSQLVVDGDANGSEVVLLDGSASTDSDGSIVSWDWLLGGNSIATGAMVSVNLAVGSHVIEFVVSDNDGGSSTGSVSISVEANILPVANAGADQSVVDLATNGSEVITLDGSASSDSDGTIVSWDWVVGGSSIATGETPTVTFVLGTHEVVLTVTDEDGGAASDTSLVTIVENLELIAVAGPDQMLNDSDGDLMEVALLDARGSIAEGTIVSWTWSSGGQLIASGEVASASFAIGVHTVRLTVVDHLFAMHEDDLVVTVLSNLAPIVQAGSDQLLSDVDRDGSETVSLNAVVAMDPDGQFVRVEWLQDGSLIATGLAASVSLPVGTNTIDLLLTDNGGATATDQVRIVITVPPNTAPTFAAYGMQRVVVDDPFILPLEATDTDAPAQTLTYSLLGPVPAGLLLDAQTGQLSWTPASNQVGSNSVIVQVSDGVDAVSVTLDFSVAEIPFIQSFAGFVSEAGEQALGFAAKPGFLYRLQHSPSLEVPVWTTLATLTADSSLGDIEFAGTAGAVGYYRVMVIPDGEGVE